MAATIKRGFPRVQHEAPITYLNVNQNHIFLTRMYSFSEGGLYFESFQSLVPDLHIYIIMTNYAPGSNGPEAYQSYLAKIRWCHKLPQIDTPRYGVGVEFLEKSHTRFGFRENESGHCCDLCDTDTTSELVCRIDDYICLCPPCFDYLEMISTGSVKESIMRFINGNVI